MEENVSIQHIGANDLYNLVDLYEELDESQVNLENMNKVIHRLKNNEDYYFLVAKNDAGKYVGSVMGLICYDLTGKCQPFMVVENLIVTQAYRKQGIAKKLMATIEKSAKERDCHSCILVTSERNNQAINLYRSLGYDDEVIRGFVKRIC